MTMPAVPKRPPRPNTIGRGTGTPASYAARWTANSARREVCGVSPTGSRRST